MKLRFLAAAALFVASSAPALADTINFGQFGSDFTAVANPASGVTQGGVDFQITGPGSGFTVLDQGDGWGGQFAAGAPVLYDNGASGAVTIAFDGSVSSLSLAYQDNYYGAFSATAIAYDGATVVGSETLSATSAYNPGTAPVFNFTGGGITSVTITSTNDGAGWALAGAAGVPEPATWAMMLLGLLGVGVMLRQGRRQGVAATA